MNDVLRQFAEIFGDMPPDQRNNVLADAIALTADKFWLTNPGPQTTAINCDADELFYGGEAGGGKSDLLCGMAIQYQHRSLLLRRESTQAEGLIARMMEILSNIDGHGFRKTKNAWNRKSDHAQIRIGGCQYEDDKQDYKGVARDFYGFDEISDFTETQFRFITGWNRSVRPDVRARVVAAGNPPTTVEGLWVVKYWAAWVDDNHRNPAREGELRWYTTIDGEDYECEGPEPIEVKGELIKPRSRTFIRAHLADNPDLADTGYSSVLAAMPEELRRAYRDGKFSIMLDDQLGQVIPSEWARQAQERWRPGVDDEVPMSALAHDVALGGGDRNVYAPRHGHWYNHLNVQKQEHHVDPMDLAGHIVVLMRDGCSIIIDMGGGYGSGVYSHLKNNLEIDERRLIGYNGANAAPANATDRSKRLKFANFRAYAYWMFREALEPSFGEPVALPPDNELKAELCATTYTVTPRGILLEDKKEVKKRIGRSPDKADAVVMAWIAGEPALQTMLKQETIKAQRAERRGGPVKVNVGHAHAKRRRN